MEMNRCKDKEKELEHFLDSMNSYFGQLKNRTDYYKMFELLRMCSLEWWHYCYYNVRKKCLTAVPSQSHKMRICRKYHIKTKVKRKSKKD